LNPADASLITHIQRATGGARALLCTLARRGKALEHDQPQRAAFLLAAVRPHPMYKGGRLAFDMLEIEDLMLDAPPLDPLSDDELNDALQALAGAGFDLTELLLRLSPDEKDSRPRSASIAGNVPAQKRVEVASQTPALPRVSFGPADDMGIAAAFGDSGSNPRVSWPELLSSDYLYDFVVLGLLDALGRGIDSRAATL
jgi:hypothetical protein